MTQGTALVSEIQRPKSNPGTTMRTSSRTRPLPRVGDNLDRLLDLLDQARAAEQARAASEASPIAPYIALLRELDRSA
jgi:hypothetical protein